MPKFYAPAGDGYWKRKVDRNVLGWLDFLRGDDTVFLEFDGDGYQIDFLVLRQHAIFVIEAKNYDEVVEATPNGEWVLAGGARVKNPIQQVTREADEFQAGVLYRYYTEIFDLQHGMGLKPTAYRIVCLPEAKISSIPVLNSVTRIYVSGDKLRMSKFMADFMWEYGIPIDKKLLKLKPANIEWLAEEIGLCKVADDMETMRQMLLYTEETSSERIVVNPYTITAGADGKDFFGRNKELSLINGAISTGQPVMLYGLQRAGKTSLAEMACFRSEIKHHLIDCRNITESSESEMYAKLCLEFKRCVKADSVEITEKEFAALVASGPSNLKFKIEQYLAFLAKERHRRYAIIFDEIQELSVIKSEKTADEFLRWLDALIRRYSKSVGLVFISRPFFESKYRETNIGRLFEKILVGALEKDPAMKLVIRPFSEAKITVTECAAEKILAVTGKFPYWTKIICRKLFEFALENKFKMIDEKQVDDFFALTNIGEDYTLKSNFENLLEDFRSIGDPGEEGKSYQLLCVIAQALENKDYVEIEDLKNTFGWKIAKVKMNLNILQTFGFIACADKTKVKLIPAIIGARLRNFCSLDIEDKLILKKEKKKCKFMVFEDVDNATCPKVHKTDCRHYKQYVQKGEATRSTKWHGPFDDHAEACKKATNIGLRQHRAPTYKPTCCF